MDLTPEDKKYLRDRRSIVRFGRMLVVGIAVGYGAFLVWVWVSAPLWLDPRKVLQRVEDGSLDEATMTLTLNPLVTDPIAPGREYLTAPPGSPSPIERGAPRSMISNRAAGPA